MRVQGLGLDQKQVGAEKREPPKIVMWIPPYGKVIECVSLEEAGRAATVYAGEHPGSTVCVYELIGKAFVAPSYPELDPVERESSALMLAAPKDNAA